MGINHSLHSYIFVTWFEDFELPEPHVEGRADQGAIWLPHYDHIDASTQCGLKGQKREEDYRIDREEFLEYVEHPCLCPSLCRLR